MPTRPHDLRPTLLALTLLLTPILPAQTPAQTRSVAITVDDLPAMSALDLTAPDITAINQKLVATLQSQHIPATGFVNEERLYKTGEVDARIAALSLWPAAGLDLGNHTFSHTSLNDAELHDWEDDVVQGESVTRILLRAHNKTLRYLRYPYLATGPDLLTHQQAEAFLSGRGYRVAPVTIDPLDWYFADLYNVAHQHSDTALETRLAQAWLAYTADVLTYTEQRSQTLLGYQPRQIILLHATWLEADHLPDLLDLLRHRGYTFLTLDAALTDPAYALPDTYISDTGATNLEHWAITQGHLPLPGSEPKLPTWVQQAHTAFEAANPD